MIITTITTIISTTTPITAIRIGFNSAIISFGPISSESIVGFTYASVVVPSLSISSDVISPDGSVGVSSDGLVVICPGLSVGFITEDVVSFGAVVVCGLVIFR